MNQGDKFSPTKSTLKGFFGLQLYEAEINKGTLVCYGIGMGLKFPLVPYFMHHLFNSDVFSNPSAGSVTLTGILTYAAVDFFVQAGKAGHNTYSPKDKLGEVEGLAGLIYRHIKK